MVTQNVANHQNTTSRLSHLDQPRLHQPVVEHAADLIGASDDLLQPPSEMLGLMNP